MATENITKISTFHPEHPHSRLVDRDNSDATLFNCSNLLAIIQELDFQDLHPATGEGINALITEVKSAIYFEAWRLKESNENTGGVMSEAKQNVDQRKDARKAYDEAIDLVTGLESFAESMADFPADSVLPYQKGFYGVSAMARRLSTCIGLLEPKTE